MIVTNEAKDIQNSRKLVIICRIRKQKFDRKIAKVYNKIKLFPLEMMEKGTTPSVEGGGLKQWEYDYDIPAFEIHPH